jgi:hypothetical protein
MKSASARSELTYEAALSKSSGSKSESTIQGRIISRLPNQIAGPRGCFPILWCLCVHDSPDNPCPCNGPIIWIPEGSIRNRRKLGRGTEGSVELDVEASARVFLEDTREIGGQDSDARLMRLGADGQFEAVTDTLWVQEFSPMRLDRLKRALELIERDPRLSAIAKKKGKGIWGKLVAAFEAGWAIGTYIDEKTGLSDKLSDWMIDTFGPWPPE